jgi:hypothetical protein
MLNCTAGDVLSKGNNELERYALRGSVKQAIRETAMAHEDKVNVPVTAKMLATKKI